MALATIRIRPWRVYVKAYKWVKEKHGTAFLARFRKHQAGLQEQLNVWAEKLLPFVPEVNRSGILAGEVERYLKGAGLKKFCVLAELGQHGDGVVVKDDHKGQALLLRIDPKGSDRMIQVERSIKMPRVKISKKKSKKSDAAVKTKKSKKAETKSAEPKERKERLLAGKFHRSEVTDMIDAYLKTTSPKTGFTRDDVMDNVFQKAPFKGSGKQVQDAVWRLLINYLWELMAAGKVAKLGRREYGFKAGTGKDLPKAPALKKSKTSEEPAKKVKKSKKSKKTKVSTDEAEPVKKVKKVKKASTDDGSAKKVKKVKKSKKSKKSAAE